MAVYFFHVYFSQLENIYEQIIQITIHYSLYSTATQNHFQWNIGGGGSPTQHFRIGRVHFMLFIPFFSAFGTQRECCSQWNMGFSLTTFSVDFKVL